jgi:hypothetical protein
MAHKHLSKTDIKSPVEGNEKGTHRKKDTRCPLSDVWCRSGEKVQAYYWGTPHGTAS